MSEGDIAGALALTRQLNAADPAVQSLMHAIHLKQAVIQTEKELLDEAGSPLPWSPEGFTGKENAREALQAALQRRQIALDLDEALRLYNDKDYQQSLDLATTVLARSPQNSDARHLQTKRATAWPRISLTISSCSRPARCWNKPAMTMPPAPP